MCQITSIYKRDFSNQESMECWDVSLVKLDYVPRHVISLLKCVITGLTLSELLGLLEITGFKLILKGH